MKLLDEYKNNQVAKRSRGCFFKSFWSAIAASLLLGAQVFATETRGITVTAVGYFPTEASEDSGILNGRAPRTSAANDSHEFTCAFNSDGGMLTAILNAALSEVLPADGFSVSLDSGPKAKTASSGGGASRLSFPWYKPNCQAASFLTKHTTALCNDFHWSQPIYEMIVGYFSAQDYDRPLDNQDDVFGTTLCLAGKEFSQMLHEVGLSDLNTRLVYRKSPAACLKAVVAKEADLTLLPINIAALETEHLALTDQIKAYYHLDRLMSLHAIAAKTSPTALDDIAVLNNGLLALRESGAWFEIIEEFADGHDHDHPYEDKVLPTTVAKSN